MEKLEPLPIRFHEAEHKYEHLPTGEIMAYSATQICGWDASPEKLANIAASKHEWEPRGHACHNALEAMLTGSQQNADDLDRFDEWITPLLEHKFWKGFDVIAAEYRMVDLKRSIGGSLDALGIYQGKTILLDLKTQKAKGRPYSTNRQCGAYVSMLCTLHPKIWIDECRTVWAKPGKTTVGPAQDPTRCCLEFCDAYADFIHYKGSDF